MTAAKHRHRPPTRPPTRLHTSTAGGWRTLAACRDQDPEMFYPISASGLAADPAKRVCATCPVRAHCLREALDLGDDHGVWGGTDPADRRAIRRGKLTIAAAITYRRPADG